MLVMILAFVLPLQYTYNMVTILSLSLVQSGSGGGVRHRSSRSLRQQSRGFVAMETEEVSLVAPDDTAEVDDDSTWEAIVPEVIPLTSSSS